MELILPQAGGTCRCSRLGAAFRPAGRRLDFGPRGAIAQLGERLDRTQEVAGSSPASSIVQRPATAGPFVSTMGTETVEIGPWSSFGQVAAHGTSFASQRLRLDETR